MRTIILAGFLAVVAVIMLYFVFSKPPYPMTEEDAKSFFLEDLREKYPDAEIREIVQVLPATAPDGTPYYQLKARVTFGMSTPCPERIHVFYDYPPKNFVAQPPEYITKDCRVCINTPICIIAFPEEAVIASHTYRGTEEIRDFVKSNMDAEAKASYFENYEGNVGVWKVVWQSKSSETGYEVLVSKHENKVISVKKLGEK